VLEVNDGNNSRLDHHYALTAQCTDSPMHTNASFALPALLLTLSLSLLSGCATDIPAAPKDERAASDPWEPMNRRIDSFNDTLDRATLKPLARGYEALLPATMRRGIGNFFDNLQAPLHIVNNLLQGKPKRAATETGRLLANSTWGILGLVDVASDIGLDPAREDFGQTLAVWGVPAGPYLVLPIFGPHTLRGAVAEPFDKALDPLYYYEHDTVRPALMLLELTDTRAGLFRAESLIEDSFDRYLSIRESYLQNREYEIYDGNPPEDEDFYEDFYDDFEEDLDGDPNTQDPQ